MKPRTHCKKGHELTGHNRMICTNRGKKIVRCGECNRVNSKRAYRKKHPKKPAELVRPRNEFGWIVPYEGTKSREAYDKLMAGYKPTIKDADYNTCWRIKNPLRILNIKRKSRGSTPRD